MISKNRLTPSGWAIIVLGVSALALGGCGRKGPLDLPPTANVAPGAARSLSVSLGAAQPSVFNPTYGSEAAPAAPRGNKRPFMLDPPLGDS